MKYLILLLLTANLGASYAQDNCSDFHVGYFEYTVHEERYIIYRTETHQIEYGLNTDDWIVLSLEWSSDCAYSMRYLSASTPGLIDIVGGKILKSRIVNSDESGYKFVSIMDGINIEDQGEISTLTSKLTSGQKKKIKRTLKKNR